MGDVIGEECRFVNGEATAAFAASPWIDIAEATTLVIWF